MIETNVIYTARAEGKEEGFKDGIQKGIEKGIQKGIQKGIEKGKIEGAKTKAIIIAKNLLKNNVDIEIIIQSTGLTQTEIEDLQK